MINRLYSAVQKPRAIIFCEKKFSALNECLKNYIKSIVCNTIPFCNQCEYCQKVDSGTYRDLIIFDGSKQAIKKDDIVFLYNPWKDINEQKMSETGRVMLASFFRDYWAADEQRNKIKAFQNNKRYQIEEENKQKYNTDIFKNRNTTINESQIDQTRNMQLVEYKENIFMKILGFFKKMFRK